MLWVSVDPFDMITPVVFLAGRRLDQYFNIMQVSVVQTFQRRRLGAKLVHKVETIAREKGFQGLSLTTSRELPWNGPAYSQIGLLEVEA